MSGQVRASKQRLLGFVLVFFFGCLAVSLAGFVLLEFILNQYDKDYRVAQVLGDSERLATEVFDRSGKKIGEISAESRFYIDVDSLPPHVIESFLAAEDAGFYSHPGVSPTAVMRAIYSNIRHGRAAQGASTITQQLARMFFLDREKTFSRKLNEAFLALTIERKLSKAKILELYLNKVYLGNQSYGIEAAARNYFRKSAQDLSLAEATMLAGLPPAPSSYAPHRHQRRAIKRQRFVLKQMVQCGFLSRKEAIRAGYERVVVHRRPIPKNQHAPYFLGALKEELARMLQLTDIDVRGMKIYTTLDSEVQSRLRRRLGSDSHAVFGSGGEDQQVAAVVLDTKSGGVLAMQGGSHYSEQKFNFASQGRRPIGTLMLPFVYGLALERGYSLLSSLYTEGKRVGDKGVVRDPMDLSLYEGLSQGLAAESARLLSWLGVGTLVEFGEKLGLQMGRKDLSLILGAARNNLLAVTAAMQIFANGGVYLSPHMIDKILLSDGREVFRYEPAPVPVLSPVASYSVQKVLSQKNNDIIASGTDRSLHDGWWIQQNAERSLGVWVGSEFGKERLASSQEALRKKLKLLGGGLSSALFKAPVSEQWPSARPPKGVVFRRQKFERFALGWRNVPGFHR